MAREDWDIKGINVYSRMSTVTNKYEGYDLYDYDFFEGDIPLEYIYRILNLSKQRFVDMLNESSNSKKHLLTSVEEDFRYHEKEYGTPYFIKESVFCGSCSVKVELADFELWLDDNYHLLRFNNVKKDSHERVTVEKVLEDTARLLEYRDKEISNLKARIAELENSFQINIEGKEKLLTTRERKTLLKLVHAAVELNGKRTIEKRGLAGELARKTEELYPDVRISERTVSDKLKEIGELEK